MSDFTSSWQGYDFSGLGALLSQMQEITRHVMEAVQSIQSALQPIVEVIEQYKPRYFVHGHVHMSYGRQFVRLDKVGETTVIYCRQLAHYLQLGKWVKRSLSFGTI